ncbi:MAG: type II toxin-antitoxin system RelE/ParE family toxin [Xanthomonadales bacterium]|nr:type II toxin-antitoxin system RelE/ParE family toxin [Xanthomonadales bacterium]
MSYELEFIDKSLKEWNKLGSTVKAQFKKKLCERLESPKIESSRVSGMTDCYKIKLRQAGYRLVYQVQDERLVVLVLVVGKRERNSVYKSAIKRI